MTRTVWAVGVFLAAAGCGPAPTSKRVLPSGGYLPGAGVSNAGPAQPRRELPSALRSGGPGLGESSEAPSGTPFELGDLQFAKLPEGGEDCAVDPARGGGRGTLQFCFELHNPNATTRTLTLPAGLILTSQVGEIQNGFVAQETRLQVPPNGTLGVVVDAFCTNESRGGPTAEDDFAAEVVTDQPDLREIAAILEEKDFSGEHTPDLVQEVVWQVTSGEGFSLEARNALVALP